MIVNLFSTVGRTSPLRMAAWIVVALGLFWAGARALQLGGLATFLLIGAIWGAFAAKLGAEAARRMHDQGRRGRAALPIIGLAAIAFGASMARWLASGPDTVFTLSMIVIALGLGVAFLRPGSASVRVDGASAFSSDASTNRVAPALMIAALLTLSGAGVGYGLFSWSEGVRRVHEANARHAAGYHPGPDPLAEEYERQGKR